MIPPISIGVIELSVRVDSLEYALGSASKLYVLFLRNSKIEDQIVVGMLYCSHGGKSSIS
jgi:hypothetical protein